MTFALTCLRSSDGNKIFMFLIFHLIVFHKKSQFLNLNFCINLEFLAHRSAASHQTHFYSLNMEKKTINKQVFIKMTELHLSSAWKQKHRMSLWFSLTLEYLSSLLFQQLLCCGFSLSLLIYRIMIVVVIVVSLLFRIILLLNWRF